MWQRAVGICNIHPSNHQISFSILCLSDVVCLRLPLYAPDILPLLILLPSVWTCRCVHLPLQTFLVCLFSFCKKVSLLHSRVGLSWISLCALFLPLLGWLNPFCFFFDSLLIIFFFHIPIKYPKSSTATRDVYRYGKPNRYMYRNTTSIPLHTDILYRNWRCLTLGQLMCPGWS